MTDTTKITELKERIVGDWDEQWSNYNPVNDTGVGVPPWSGGDYEQMKDFLSQALDETIRVTTEETRNETLLEAVKIVEWELTPHGYESDDPKYERFAIKLKEKYSKEIKDKLQTIADKK